MNDAPRIDIDSRLAAALPATRPAAAPTSGPGSFADALASADCGVKFSAHAQTRLQSRQLSLTAGDLEKMGDALTKAAAKGARSSLLLLDKTAFVVSVPNRTVITAVDTTQMKEQIFTNIDSAMIL